MGGLKNQNYRVLDHNPEKLTCRMEPTRTFVITPTAPLEVDPQEPVHQVLNLTEYGERAVSLHVYSQPIPSCEVYLPNSGTYSDVTSTTPANMADFATGKRRSVPDEGEESETLPSGSLENIP